MTEHFWQSLRSSIRRCAMAYESPTRRFENEQIRISETDVLTVSIAGSNDVYDWIQNCNVDQVAIGKWTVSEGVLNAAKNVMSMVDEFRSINESAYIKPLVFEGHSKGGAVALVCGMLSIMRHNEVQRVTTFAAPRISTMKIDYPFPCTQVSAKGDPVPMLPVWRPWKRWQHSGTTIRIGKQSAANLGREWFGFLGKPIKRHLVANYLEIFE